MASQYRWILDFGHGGMDQRGLYTSGLKKRYKFANHDNFEIFEGKVNREIGYHLVYNLQKAGIDYDVVCDSILDTSLRLRVERADAIFQRERDLTGRMSIFVSIHCNAATNSIEGDGSNATGFEIFTSKGQTKSDIIADIFYSAYESQFSDRFSMRRDRSDGDYDKEADFYVLRKTDCPAILLENLFYDNYKEAQFLDSLEGVCEIADTIFKAIQLVEDYKPI